MSEQIEKIRHSLSHLLAASVQYFFPEVKFGIGPAIENGFYYDFDKVSLEEEDLEKIEGKMKELIAQNLIFDQKMISKEEARSLFKEQPYKLELIDKIEEDAVSIYQIGNFIDLCKGPHVASTQEINPQGFKLQKIAGAYWQGDEKKPMLARIYGLAFETKAELDDYLNKQAEAEKRDHRKLGKELDLFHIDEEVGIGLILWHPKGAILWRIIEDFWFKQHLENGYELVRTPHIGNRKLWEHSGHWGFYSNSMYPP
ncbi:MAG TPA: threonine--tRNA ligase, partial [Candidatus Pacearchaeota archaeon]|nr:threonine--tRNA ligase [Candidatus Pacearchaeota archaeon]